MVLGIYLRNTDRCGVFSAADTLVERALALGMGGKRLPAPSPSVRLRLRGERFKNIASGILLMGEVACCQEYMR